jgi:alpha-ketoglutaric semialdehyde dehydrogenase
MSQEEPMGEVHRNLIAGEWVEGEGETENVNPSNTDEVIGIYASSGKAQVARAVESARAAAPAWARSPVQSRHDILRKAADEISARKDELGRLLAREEGKTLPEATAEVVRAAQIFAFFAGEAVRISGETIDSVRPGIEVSITREPVGIIGLITPWNFPIAIPAWKIAPALAYGNTVVFKPADLVPGSAWALVDILHRAGVPAGVLNLVMGPGSKVGEAMLESEDVDAVSFTGSLDVGRHAAEACARHMRRVQIEMGSKNPLVVLEDCDLPTAVACAVNGAFYSTGQRCTASSRLVVAEPIHDQFVDALTQRMQGLVVDDAVKDGTQIGPVVSQPQLDQDLDYLRLGQEEGATLHWGGERLNRETPGYYLQPALFTDTANDMRINREEIFGPIASVIRVRDYDEALAVANDTPFGLSAGICTRSLKHASHFRRNAQFGLVMVNLPTAGVDYHVPFGGRKASSYGPREQGRYAREFFTQIKTAYTQP